MESILSRYRNLTILAVVLFLQVLGLAVQVKQPAEHGSTSLLRSWTVAIVSPLQKSVVYTTGWFGGLWRNYFYLRAVRDENRELREQLDRLRVEQVRLSEDAAQARRLQALLEFKEQYIARTVAAQVIGSGGGTSSRVIFIDKGESHGVRPDMAVITPQGLVGRTVRVFPSTSQVLLINDQSSGMGGILESSRLHGIVRGTPDGLIVLEYIMVDEKVEVGDKVLASGGDRIFPKGLPVGTVAAVRPGEDHFLEIRLRPAADLGRLEEVLVLTGIEQRTPEIEEAGAKRAVDTLADRLPRIRKKPPEPAKPTPAPRRAATRAPAAAAPPPRQAAGGGTAAEPVRPPAQQAAGGGTAAEPVRPPTQEAAGGGAAAAEPVRPATPPESEETPQR